MTETTCRRNDCLNFYVRRERVGYSPNEIFCLAGVGTPPRTGMCERYMPPSWKPDFSKKRGAR